VICKYYGKVDKQVNDIKTRLVVMLQAFCSRRKCLHSYRPLPVAERFSWIGLYLLIYMRANFCASASRLFMSVTVHDIGLRFVIIHLSSFSFIFFTHVLSLHLTKWSRSSSVSIVTRLRDWTRPVFNSRYGRGFLSWFPPWLERLWSPPNLLSSDYRVSFPG
jgi:hypothetical protein